MRFLKIPRKFLSVNKHYFNGKYDFRGLAFSKTIISLTQNEIAKVLLHVFSLVSREKHCKTCLSNSMFRLKE